MDGMQRWEQLLPNQAQGWAALPSQAQGWAALPSLGLQGTVREQQDVPGAATVTNTSSAHAAMGHISNTALSWLGPEEGAKS